MAIPLMNDDVAIIQKLSDLPNQEDGLSAAQMKEKFDEASVLIKAYLNGTLAPAVQQLQNALNDGEIIGVDDTLSIAGWAADAKATGEAVAAVRLTATEDTPGTVTLALGGDDGDIRPAVPKVYYDNDFNTNADGITFETEGSAHSSIMYSKHKVDTASGNGYLYLNSHSNANPVAYWNKGENGKAIQELSDKFVMSFDIALLAGKTTYPLYVTLVDENGKYFNVMDIASKQLRVLYRDDEGKNASVKEYLSVSESESNPTYYPVTIAFNMDAKTFTISGTDSTGTPYEFADCKMRIPDGFGTVQYIAFKARNDNTTYATNTGAFLLDNLKIYDPVSEEEKKPLRGVRFPGLDGIFTIPQADSIEDTGYPGCYYRMVDGVQEWMNPPMAVGVEYRTTERWGGKPVYTRLIDCGIVGNSGAYELENPIKGANIISYEGLIASGHTYRTLPVSTCIVWIDNTAIRFTIDNDGYIGWNITLKVKYIKH